MADETPFVPSTFPTPTLPPPTPSPHPPNVFLFCWPTNAVSGIPSPPRVREAMEEEIALVAGQRIEKEGRHGDDGASHVSGLSDRDMSMAALVTARQRRDARLSYDAHVRAVNASPGRKRAAEAASLAKRAEEVLEGALAGTRTVPPVALTPPRPPMSEGGGEGGEGLSRGRGLKSDMEHGDTHGATMSKSRSRSAARSRSRSQTRRPGETMSVSLRRRGKEDDVSDSGRKGVGEEGSIAMSCGVLGEEGSVVRKRRRPPQHGKTTKPQSVDPLVAALAATSAATIAKTKQKESAKKVHGWMEEKKRKEAQRIAKKKAKEAAAAEEKKKRLEKLKEETLKARKRGVKRRKQVQPPPIPTPSTKPQHEQEKSESTDVGGGGEEEVEVEVVPEQVEEVEEVEEEDEDATGMEREEEVREEEEAGVDDEDEEEEGGEEEEEEEEEEVVEEEEEEIVAPTPTKHLAVERKPHESPAEAVVREAEVQRRELHRMAWESSRREEKAAEQEAARMVSERRHASTDASHSPTTSPSSLLPPVEPTDVDLGVNEMGSKTGKMKKGKKGGGVKKVKKKTATSTSKATTSKPRSKKKVVSTPKSSEGSKPSSKSSSKRTLPQTKPSPPKKAIGAASSGKMRKKPSVPVSQKTSVKKRSTQQKPTPPPRSTRRRVRVAGGGVVRGESTRRRPPVPATRGRGKSAGVRRKGGVQRDESEERHVVESAVDVVADAHAHAGKRVLGDLSGGGSWAAEHSEVSFRSEEAVYAKEEEEEGVGDVDGSDAVTALRRGSGRFEQREDEEYEDDEDANWDVEVSRSMVGDDALDALGPPPNADASTVHAEAPNTTRSHVEIATELSEAAEEGGEAFASALRAAERSIEEEEGLVEVDDGDDNDGGEEAVEGEEDGLEDDEGLEELEEEDDDVMWDAELKRTDSDSRRYVDAQAALEAAKAADEMVMRSSKRRDVDGDEGEGEGEEEEGLIETLGEFADLAATVRTTRTSSTTSSTKAYSTEASPGQSKLDSMRERLLRLQNESALVDQQVADAAASGAVIEEVTEETEETGETEDDSSLVKPREATPSRSTEESLDVSTTAPSSSTSPKRKSPLRRAHTSPSRRGHKSPPRKPDLSTSPYAQPLPRPKRVKSFSSTSPTSTPPRPTSSTPSSPKSPASPSRLRVTATGTRSPRSPSRSPGGSSSHSLKKRSPARQSPKYRPPASELAASSDSEERTERLERYRKALGIDDGSSVDDSAQSFGAGSGRGGDTSKEGKTDDERSEKLDVSKGSGSGMRRDDSYASDAFIAEEGGGDGGGDGDEDAGHRRTHVRKPRKEPPGVPSREEWEATLSPSRRTYNPSIATQTHRPTEVDRYAEKVRALFGGTGGSMDPDPQPIDLNDGYSIADIAARRAQRAAAGVTSTSTKTTEHLASQPPSSPPSSPTHQSQSDRKQLSPSPMVPPSTVASSPTSEGGSPDSRRGLLAGVGAADVAAHGWLSEDAANALIESRASAAAALRMYEAEQEMRQRSSDDTERKHGGDEEGEDGKEDEKGREGSGLEEGVFGKGEGDEEIGRSIDDQAGRRSRDEEDGGEDDSVVIDDAHGPVPVRDQRSTAEELHARMLRALSELDVVDAGMEEAERVALVAQQQAAAAQTAAVTAQWAAHQEEAMRLAELVEAHEAAERAADEGAAQAAAAVAEGYDAALREAAEAHAKAQASEERASGVPDGAVESLVRAVESVGAALRESHLPRTVGVQAQAPVPRGPGGWGGEDGGRTPPALRHESSAYSDTFEDDEESRTSRPVPHGRIPRREPSMGSMRSIPSAYTMEFDDDEEEVDHGGDEGSDGIVDEIGAVQPQISRGDSSTSQMIPEEVPGLHRERSDASEIEEEEGVRDVTEDQRPSEVDSTDDRITDEIPSSIHNPPMGDLASSYTYTEAGGSTLPPTTPAAGRFVSPTAGDHHRTASSIYSEDFASGDQSHSSPRRRIASPPHSGARRGEEGEDEGGGGGGGGGGASSLEISSMSEGVDDTAGADGRELLRAFRRALAQRLRDELALADTRAQAARRKASHAASSVPRGRRGHEARARIANQLRIDLLDADARKADARRAAWRELMAFRRTLDLDELDESDGGDDVDEDRMPEVEDDALTELLRGTTSGVQRDRSSPGTSEVVAETIRQIFNALSAQSSTPAPQLPHPSLPASTTTSPPHPQPITTPQSRLSPSPLVQPSPHSGTSDSLTGGDSYEDTFEEEEEEGGGGRWEKGDEAGGGEGDEGDEIEIEDDIMEEEIPDQVEEGEAGDEEQFEVVELGKVQKEKEAGDKEEREEEEEEESAPSRIDLGIGSPTGGEIGQDEADEVMMWGSRPQPKPTTPVVPNEEEEHEVEHEEEHEEEEEGTASKPRQVPSEEAVDEVVDSIVDSAIDEALRDAQEARAARLAEIEAARQKEEEEKMRKEEERKKEEAERQKREEEERRRREEEERRALEEAEAKAKADAEAEAEAERKRIEEQEKQAEEELRLAEEKKAREEEERIAKERAGEVEEEEEEERRAAAAAESDSQEVEEGGGEQSPADGTIEEDGSSSSSSEIRSPHAIHESKSPERGDEEGDGEDGEVVDASDEIVAAWIAEAVSAASGRRELAARPALEEAHPARVDFGAIRRAMMQRRRRSHRGAASGTSSPPSPRRSAPPPLERVTEGDAHPRKSSTTSPQSPGATVPLLGTSPTPTPPDGLDGSPLTPDGPSNTYGSGGDGSGSGGALDFDIYDFDMEGNDSGSGAQRRPREHEGDGINLDDLPGMSGPSSSNLGGLGASFEPSTEILPDPAEAIARERERLEHEWRVESREFIGEVLGEAAAGFRRALLAAAPQQGHEDDSELEAAMEVALGALSDSGAAVLEEDLALLCGEVDDKVPATPMSPPEEGEDGEGEDRDGEVLDEDEMAEKRQSRRSPLPPGWEQDPLATGPVLLSSDEPLPLDVFLFVERRRLREEDGSGEGATTQVAVETQILHKALFDAAAIWINRRREETARAGGLAAPSEVITVIERRRTAALIPVLSEWYPGESEEAIHQAAAERAALPELDTPEFRPIVLRPSDRIALANYLASFAAHCAAPDQPLQGPSVAARVNARARRDVLRLGTWKAGHRELELVAADVATGILADACADAARAVSEAVSQRGLRWSRS